MSGTDYDESDMNNSNNNLMNDKMNDKTNDKTNDSHLKINNNKQIITIK